MTRDVIATAKGLLMERFDLSSAEAFALMTRLSQTSGVRVHLIAVRMVIAHEKQLVTPT